MLTMYLMERKRITYDSMHDLFWVHLPDDTYQVAVWMLLFYEEYRVGKASGSGSQTVNLIRSRGRIDTSLTHHSPIV